MGGQKWAGAETHTYSAESLWLNHRASLGGEEFARPAMPPKCQHPGCQNAAEPLASEILEASTRNVLAIQREGSLVAVGKFSNWALTQLLRPGDVLFFDNRPSVVVQPFPESSEEES